MLSRPIRGLARTAGALRYALAQRSYAVDKDFVSVVTIHKELVDFLRKRGHISKSENDLTMSQKEWAAIVAKDPEVQQMQQHLQSKLDWAIHASGVRIRERVPSRKPVRVAVTGAAGAIGYAALFRIAAGQMLGDDQPIHLQLLELPQAKQALEGVVMELQDCAFPLLSSITTSDDPVKAFEGADYALLIGAKPRSKGMERADLLKANADIFKVQGEALNKSANRETLRVVVVGNPANTNAWIAANSAKDLSPTQFSALTRLDHDRGLAQIALKTGVHLNHIERFCIWGNHSSTMVPDVNNMIINNKWGRDAIGDNKWIDEKFVPTVANRGAAIIAARGASSAASAANAAIKHMRDWTIGTNGMWTSMAVWSDGSYGAEPGVFFSYPVVCVDGCYTIVQNVPIDPATAKKMEASNQELIAERDAVASAMGIKKPSMQETFKHWKAQFDKEGKLPYYFPPIGPPKVTGNKA